MLNAERDYNLLGQRKYINASLNPNLNLIANLTLKLLKVRKLKVFYGRDYSKICDIRFRFR